MRKKTKTFEDKNNLKITPYSIDAEQSVIGGLMLDNSYWDKVGDILKEEDFYLPQHRIIFSAINNLANRGQPFDILMLSDYLKNIGQLETIGGEVVLFEFAKNTPSIANIHAYAEIVREKSIKRQLLGISAGIADSVYKSSGNMAADILDEAESKIFQIAEQKKHQTGDAGFMKLEAILKETITDIDKLANSPKSLSGISTGYKDLDKMTQGFQKSDLIVIAARPSMGKTSFAMNIAENVAIKEKQPVLIFSLEMSDNSLSQRMISSTGRIDQQNLRSATLSGEEWERMGKAVDVLSKAMIFIDEKAAITPMEMRARARRAMREYGQIGLIVVDYLQLMCMPGFQNNKVGEITEISRSLKALAKEINAPVVALSQLNRGVDQRTDKRPIMSDLRDSGAIEQDADLILFIYRDEVYNQDTNDKGIAEIIVAKQRNGPIGKVKLTFLDKYTRFENYVPEHFSIKNIEKVNA